MARFSKETRARNRVNGIESCGCYTLSRFFSRYSLRKNVTKVWILSELYFPEQTVPSPFLTRIAEGLAPHWRVQVVCSQPTYAARGIRAAKREERHGVYIRRVTSTTLDKDVIIYRIINFVTISLSIFFVSLRHVRRGDIVLVMSNPPLLPFLAVVLCRLRGAKSILMIQDVYPEILICAGITGPDSILARFGYWATRKLYRSCDSLVVLGRDMANLAAQKIEGLSGKIKIITNWGDWDYISPRDRDENSLLQQLQLADHFVVQYSGNMGRTHGLEDLIQAARKLVSSPEIHFLFIGSGAKRRWLEKKIRESELKNLTILPPRSRQDLPDSLNACDLAVVALSPGMSGVSVPSRMYNIMANPS